MLAIQGERAIEGSSGLRVPAVDFDSGALLSVDDALQFFHALAAENDFPEMGPGALERNSSYERWAPATSTEMFALRGSWRYLNHADPAEKPVACGSNGVVLVAEHHEIVAPPKVGVVHPRSLLRVDRHFVQDVTTVFGSPDSHTTVGGLNGYVGQNDPPHIQDKYVRRELGEAYDFLTS